MFTSKQTGRIFVYTLLGLASWNDCDRAAQVDDGPGPKSAVVSATAPATPATRFVILRDGRIIQGTLSEEDDLLVITQPVGAMKFPKRKLERICGSLAEVYAWKLEQLPEDDPDERMKLARWCLSQKLVNEARGQLEAILKLDPKSAQAKAMLISMDQEAARLARRSREKDPEVTQTGGEQNGVDGRDRPGMLDMALVQGAKRGMGIPDLPVIFDLPPGLAYRRFEEFNRYVHPVLQMYCARCHNEKYDGSFQLIQYMRKADRRPDTLRNNLDATLKLIDRENPGRSELLASSLRPHGRGPNTRPIFKGSNDTSYQILATWVRNLQARKSVDDVSPARIDPTSADHGERFATDRSRIARLSDASDRPPSQFPTARGEVKTLPPTRFVPGRGMVVDDGADPSEFPIPFQINRAKPEPRATTPPGLPPLPGQAGDNERSSTGANARPAKQGAPLKTSDSSEPTAHVESDEPAMKTPSKPVKLDPSLLEKALRARNQGRGQ